MGRYLPFKAACPSRPPSPYFIDMSESPTTAVATPPPRARAGVTKPEDRPKLVEIGGPPGPEPTRYGDWERNGRCVDF